MKAHSRNKGRSTPPRRPPEGPNPDQILHRIKAVTGELEALQSEIQHRIDRGAGRSSSAGDDASRARLLGEFKVTLDRLRNLLWFYLEQIASQPATGVKQPPSEPASSRRSLYPQSAPDETQDTPPGSFFERLDVVIDAYMKNTGPRKRAKN
jgi:hypothetical protein